MNLDTDIISDQDELLILVDREDNELGFASKENVWIFAISKASCD